MTTKYKERNQYVICTHCSSHILLYKAFLEPYIENFNDYYQEDDDSKPKSIVISFTCDWDPCSEDFEALVDLNMTGM